MKRLLFLGDSITDCQRLWLQENHSLGNGYVWEISRSFASRQLHLQILNKGHDGFTIQSILRNLKEDCLSYHPDCVTILAGINNIGIARNTGRSLEAQNFETNYADLVYRIKKETHAAVICLGPFLFPHPQEYALWMEDITFVERTLRTLDAPEEGIHFLPLHQYLNGEALRQGYDAITTDGIHLTERGHRLIAALWLDFYDYCFRQTLPLPADISSEVFPAG